MKIVSLNVRYKSATVDEFIENHAHDVSRGGIFIKTANPFPPGTLLKFEIRLSSDQAVIAGVGRIVWKRDAGASNGERPAGMGVKFIKIDEPSRVVIDKLMNTRVDAGKSFETHDDTTDSDRPPPRTPPPPRPPVSASLPAAAPPKASGTRSISPGADMSGSSKGSGPKAIPTPGGTPLPRKATMLGLGASSAPRPMSSPPGTSPGSASPPKRTPIPVAPTMPPRPSAGGVMFPKTGFQNDGPEKPELTVMKQAAELLEEALREAGGSMEEIGTNPLFSGQDRDAMGATQPVTPAHEWTTADTPQA
ncbi:MAG: TIGR02266 family protein, partial [Myxococcota bacterium]|nr:TIGR02266 family protein [Myxococcota bacterium]